MQTGAAFLPKGTWQPRFESVKNLFREVVLESQCRCGGALCVYQDGQPVLDIWGGEAGENVPWSADTVLPLTSISKPIFTFAILRLAQIGLLDIEAPVAEYWTEFAANGKRDLKVSHILSHSAGLPMFPRPVTLDEQIARKPVLRQLEQMRPLWPPGTAHGYHAITFGFLTTELLHRVTGLAPAEALDQLVSKPLDVNLSLGLPANMVASVAQVVPSEVGTRPELDNDPEISAYRAAMVNEASMLYRATFGSTYMTFEDMNRPDYITAPRPSGYGTARDVARVFAAAGGALGDREFLSAEIRGRMVKVHSCGTDKVFEVFSRWGLGVLLHGTRLLPDLPTGAFGHLGSTGASAFADPARRLSFAFFPNRMKSVFEIPDKRAALLAACVYDCLSRSSATVSR